MGVFTQGHKNIIATCFLNVLKSGVLGMFLKQTALKWHSEKKVNFEICGMEIE